MATKAVVRNNLGGIYSYSPFFYEGSRENEVKKKDDVDALTFLIFKGLFLFSVLNVCYIVSMPRATRKCQY